MLSGVVFIFSIITIVSFESDSLVFDMSIVEPKSASSLKDGSSLIIVTQFLESLAFYGVAGSLVLFFQTQLDMSNTDTVNTFYFWNGVVYVSPLLGGYVADTFLGRYETIWICFMIYLIGMVSLLFGSIPGHINSSLVYFGMFVVALGAGGIKPNLSTFGADQFNLKLKQDESEVKQYFTYFYWAINFGALISYTAVAYICQHGLLAWGGAKWGFFSGFLIATVSLSIGIVVFLLGANQYNKCAPQGSIMLRSFSTVYKAMVLHRKKKTDISVSDQYGNITTTQEKKVCHWLDIVSTENGGSYSKNEVESVKYVLKLLPFLLILIIYKGINGNRSTAFHLQACQMNNKINKKYDLPVSTISIFNNIAVLALIPISTHYIYPMIQKTGCNLTMLQKMSIGFCMSALAMIVATVVELYRVKYTPPEGGWYDWDARYNISPCRNIDNYNPERFKRWFDGTSDVNIPKPLNCWVKATCDLTYLGAYLPIDCVSCDNIPQMSSMSIFWQAPQFIVIGIAEIFASITALEFFYSQTPQSMRSVSQALNLFTNALGSWLTIPLTLLVNYNPNHPWITSNINEGHLDYYFILLATLMLSGLVVFVYLANHFVYADADELDILNQTPLVVPIVVSTIESIHSSNNSSSGEDNHKKQK